MNKEERRESITERYIAFILRNRIAVLLAIVMVTAFFGYKAFNIEIKTDFYSLYPPKHPYIQLYKEYQDMFGSANVLLCAVEVKKGDIYDCKTIAKIDRITKAILETKGCDALQVASITHPKVKNIMVTNWGVVMRPLMYPGLPKDKVDLDRLKGAVHENKGIIGFYVSYDEKSAAIIAGFWEKGTDPLDIYSRVKEIVASEKDDNTNIYFTGYPMLYAYIYHLAPQIYIVFAATLILFIVLLFYYFRSLQGICLPIISGVMSAIWGLGFASLLGYSLDPLILVIPVIITARALSHSVQCLARYNEEYFRFHDQREAIVKGYGELFAPATLSIVTDAVGVLLISVATIPLMRHLGFFASFWIFSIVVSVPTLTPILLSYIKPPNLETIEQQAGGRVYNYIGEVFLKASTGIGRWVLLVVIVLVVVVGGNYALKLEVGNTEAGASMLFPDHPYNMAFKFFNENFVGATKLTIIAEGKEKGAIKNYESLKLIEEFQDYMELEGGASGTMTFTSLIKGINRMFHEANPKWSMIPKEKKFLAEIGFIIRSNSSAGEMDRLLSPDWSNATITCFYKDYNNDVIKLALSKAEAFSNSRKSKSEDKIRLRLAGGLMGILSAVNEEVEYSYWVSLIVVFLTVFILCVLTFRSLLVGLILIIPLLISEIICEVFMLVKGIDLNINSLPVAAIAVGIGIDYGIYLMARIAEEYPKVENHAVACAEAMATTGKAIIFTATTVTAGALFWVFVDLKFQAEMGLLLVLLMLLNMLNALIFIPGLVCLFKPKFGGPKKIAMKEVISQERLLS
ncbi:MAG: efflux RND transporter permease subunit [Dissulfuribacterales bacterium]